MNTLSPGASGSRSLRLLFAWTAAAWRRSSLRCRSSATSYFGCTSPRMPHTLGEIFAHAQSLDFKNRNSWAGPGAASVPVDQHVRSGPETASAASAVANCGWNYCWWINWQRRLESWSSSSSTLHYKEVGLQEWPLAGRATIPRVLYGISLCMSLRRRTILSKCLRAPAPVDLTIHTFRTVDRTAGRRFAVVARFGKRWEFGDNRKVCKAFVCQYAPPRSCCSWGPAEAKCCMPAPRPDVSTSTPVYMWWWCDRRWVRTPQMPPFVDRTDFFHLHSSLKT